MELVDVIREIPCLMRKRSKIINKISALKVNDINRINIIASGTSYNAAFALKLIFWNKYGVKIDCFYPNYFLNNFNKNSIESNSVYIFVSQGGKTKSIIDVIQLISSNSDVVTISLTEAADTPIGRITTHNVEIGSEKEPYVFRTSGYTLTFVTLYVLMNYLMLNTSDKRIIEEINIWADEVEYMINMAEDWYWDNRDDLLKRKTLFFAGGGELWAVAKEADIKFMEMVPIITKSYEIEELIHGPQNAFTKDCGFFLMANNGSDYQKANQINEYLNKELGAKSYLLTNLKDDDKKSVQIKTSTEMVVPQFITFFQVVSYYLAKDNNRDLTKRINSGIDKYLAKQVK